MILKKYNTIIYVYFIILLYFVVINAQEETGKTVSGGSETTTSTSSGNSNSTKLCAQSEACLNANSTLNACKGAGLNTPDYFIEKGKNSGVYEPTDRNLARCMCNQPFYDTLTECIECFAKATGKKFEVAPLNQYKKDCDGSGTPFTQTATPPKDGGLPPKIKWGLIGALIFVIMGLIGMGLLKLYRRTKKAKEAHRITVEGGSDYSTDGPKYPPPQSPTTYPPPPQSTTAYPPPQLSTTYNYQYASPSAPYYPPPPSSGEYPPPQQQHQGQGGQSDSYYDGTFK